MQSGGLLPEDAQAYYALWLGTVGLSHSPVAMAAFARAHRVMCGQQTEIFQRGYQTWLSQRGIADTVSAFAEYITPRYGRWRLSFRDSEVVELLVALGHQRSARAA